MQFKSARQAWHDAFYNKANSTLNSTVEACKSGILARPSDSMSGNWKKTKEGSTDNGSYRDDSAQLFHRAQAGQIQHAIAQLPENLRRFGMYLYAPVSMVTVEDGEEAVAMLYGRVMQKWLSNLKQRPSHARYEDVAEKLTFILRGYLMRHRCLVNYQDDPFRTLKQLRSYLNDEYGLGITAQDFKMREWGGIFEIIKDEIDRADRAALGPVAVVVERYKDIRQFEVDLKIIVTG